MAMIQAMPIASEHQNPESEHKLQTSAASPILQSTMGSVGSLVSGRNYHDKHCKATEYNSKCRKTGQMPNIFRQQDGHLKNGYSQDCIGGVASKRQCSAVGKSGTYAYLTEDHRNGVWSMTESPSSPCSNPEDFHEARSTNGNIQGPPPKIIPVSGKLEKNIEKNLIRPTAFKPVLTKNRSSVQYLVPRLANGGLSDSQGSLNILFNGGSVSSVNSVEKPSSLQAYNCRSSVHSGTMSDSGRNSLSSLPTYSTGCGPHLEGGAIEAGGQQQQQHVFHERGMPGGLSNSDSGRSSSSKSTASLTSRGPLLSDGGSCDRSPVSAHELLVRELEDKLRERDAELQQLRLGLDESESALCRLYEAKRCRCEQEMEELRQSCTNKLKQNAQKAQRVQQVLQLQLFQLQQEKKKLQEDFAQLLQERELLEKKYATIEKEQTELGPRLEETKWEVCQKSGEISLLKQQLKDSQAEVSLKGNEIVSLKAQLREIRAELQDHEDEIHEFRDSVHTKTLELEVCENELQRKKNEAEFLREKVGKLEEETVGLREALGHTRHMNQEQEDPALVYESDEAKVQRQNTDSHQTLRQQVEKLRAELMYERKRCENQLENFEVERRTWQGEKEKVIRYQKQLQHNYIQMYRRNRELEREMRQLTLELESREIGGIEVQNKEIRFEEITATEI
ncbi:leucine zipper putative tumor suppressor 2a [Chiloscyllium plagiosum]|uniref:leucine zipper putative tumor suppressor 2a n=1 Tax=Chiloscyllium plagiosum TaxID=36176 RepID=UPI001CB803E6|nr:leucine zipper putative tumor suppressor 2a [Chiloscyllium plagiosum]XP_043569006.1 leucine zipper putative tumor suppressor 2a [Chiloscyllium plagiosum]XP_043569007.1 leucine zipper putative tumor suppressor 2a [Chiloscyllium plagiosum]XP_043569008.1 leucine zipper putative tumor suppressor 2a [Chiloscyllium plagiosum]XP_043569009.1 leucine zipper putative tumor suppressor 2a [Chiloscyllium plagiosum]XP_043569010.1 leucine zipper putative tumor suppressor 2a [Chiloscyllium plagiosum]XP_04